jgi:excisionase family DNA binding protein
MTDLMAIQEVAKVLSISPWTVRAHLRRGNIRPVRCGRRVLVHREEVDRVSRQGLPTLGVAAKAAK